MASGFRFPRNGFRFPLYRPSPCSPCFSWLNPRAVAKTPSPGDGKRFSLCPERVPFSIVSLFSAPPAVDSISKLPVPLSTSPRRASSTVFGSSSRHEQFGNGMRQRPANRGDVRRQETDVRRQETEILAARSRRRVGPADCVRPTVCSSLRRACFRNPPQKQGRMIIRPYHIAGRVSYPRPAKGEKPSTTETQRKSKPIPCFSLVFLCVSVSLCLCG
jgi:hypothetical protein